MQPYNNIVKYGHANGEIMTDLIDRIYYKELSEQDPTEVCRRALCSYDDMDKYYKISIWGELYKVYPHQYMIKCNNEKHERFYSYFDLFTIHYLLKVKETDLVNQWISEKDIPGGTTFFRGPHEIPTNFITTHYNDYIEGFKNKCEQLMGSPLPMADAAFAFKIAPRVPVAVLYWKGDDEFPTESKILFDRTIYDHLALDIIYALAVGVCERLGKSVN